jgi:hypothetical protein
MCLPKTVRKNFRRFRASDMRWRRDPQGGEKRGAKTGKTRRGKDVSLHVLYVPFHVFRKF